MEYLTSALPDCTPKEAFRRIRDGHRVYRDLEVTKPVARTCLGIEGAGSTLETQGMSVLIPYHTEEQRAFANDLLDLTRKHTGQAMPELCNVLEVKQGGVPWKSPLNNHYVDEEWGARRIIISQRNVHEVLAALENHKEKHIHR